jgi:hypothetical protein
MYIGIPKNRISVIVIEYICINKTVILLVIIVPGIIIIRGWFYEKIIGHEVITVSLTGYTNKGIYIA